MKPAVETPSVVRTFATVAKKDSKRPISPHLLAIDNPAKLEQFSLEHHRLLHKMRQRMHTVPKGFERKTLRKHIKTQKFHRDFLMERAQELRGIVRFPRLTSPQSDRYVHPNPTIQSLTVGPIPTASSAVADVPKVKSL